LKSATTLSSTVFCSGASPPPRQQYQRISTGPPGGTVAGPADAGGADAWAATDGVAPDAGGLVVVEPLHAVVSSAKVAIRTPGSKRTRGHVLLLLFDVAGQPVDAVVVGVLARDRSWPAVRGAVASGAASADMTVVGSACQLARTTTRST